jgi:hypothetical protein
MAVNKHTSRHKMEYTLNTCGIFLEMFLITINSKSTCCGVLRIRKDMNENGISNKKTQRTENEIKKRKRK